MHKADGRSNWSPEVARNLILRYSKEGDVLLNPMISGDTTVIEVKLHYIWCGCTRCSVGLAGSGVLQLDGNGALAERLRRGLQNLVDGFDSRTCLHYYSRGARPSFCVRSKSEHCTTPPEARLSPRAKAIFVQVAQ